MKLKHNSTEEMLPPENNSYMDKEVQAALSSDSSSTHVRVTQKSISIFSVITENQES